MRGYAGEGGGSRNRLRERGEEKGASVQLFPKISLDSWLSLILPAKGGKNQYTYIARRVVCHQLLVLDDPPFLSLPYTHTLCSIYVRMGRGGETNIQVL